MERIQRTTLSYQAGTSDKIYEVDLCKTPNNEYLVNFRYGRRGNRLREGTKTKQPVSLTQAESIFNKLVNEKIKSGYQDISEADQIPSQVSSSRPNSRQEAIIKRIQEWDNSKSNWPLDRAIWRAGELKIQEVIPLLIPHLGSGNPLRDYCIIWTIGKCGDSQYRPLIREIYDNTTAPDYIRRLAFEVLLSLSNEAEKETLRQEKIADLPAELQEAIQNQDINSLAQAVENTIQTNLAELNSKDVFRTILDYVDLEQIPQKLRQLFEAELRQSSRLLKDYPSLPSTLFSIALGNYLASPDYTNPLVIIEIFYQINHSITRPILLDILKRIPLTTGYFKQVRHIFKIAEYRRDTEVLSLLSYRFETTKANHTYPRQFSKKARNYLLRRIWRTLRKLGEEGSSNYVKMAVEILLKYSDSDAKPISHKTYYRYDGKNRTTLCFHSYWDKFANYFVFNHILYENSPRYELKAGTIAWRCQKDYLPGNPAPTVREEAFPKLWEEQPEALLTLLLESDCYPVHEFAAKVLRFCQYFWQEIEIEKILKLLNKPYDITVEVAFEIAREQYNPNKPNIDLGIALANCSFEPARQQTHAWIEAQKRVFLQNSSAVTALITSPYSDTRLFTRRLLSTNSINDKTAKVILGRVIANLLTLTPEEIPDRLEGNQILEIGGTLLICFPSQLRTISFAVILDLLKSPLAEVQEIGARILLHHETPAENLPLDLIESLIASPSESIRNIGVNIFGQLPEKRLLQEYDLIVAIASHSLPDLRQSIRPIIQKLASHSPEFSQQIAEELINFLLLREKHEGIHQDLMTILKEDVTEWQETISKDTTMRLIRSKSSATQELGGLILQAKYTAWLSEFSILELVKLANSEILIIRQVAWAMFETKLADIRGNSTDKLAAVRILESKWEDTRNFAWTFFNQNFTDEDWTLEVMITICDSIKEDVRQFGRDLVIRYFEQDYGDEYLQKFSQHPSADMQLFATNYLETFAADNCDRLRSLTPYFITILSAVNRGRVAKDRVFTFLEKEALKSEEAAQIVAEILTRQSATIAIGDKATALQIMLKIHQTYPSISLPIQLKPILQTR
ncbi:MAG: WGR domain-containing protein [Chroococcales cyanobacterium]